MEAKAITRIIVWTGQRWVDQETGIYVSALGPPPNADGLLQPEQHHPFDKSFTVTYEQVQKMIADRLEIADLWTPERVDQINLLIEAVVERLIDSHIIPSYPAYFFKGDWLVTYDWLIHLTDMAEERAVKRAGSQFRNRFPRWLRWLIR